MGVLCWAEDENTHGVGSCSVCKITSAELRPCRVCQENRHEEVYCSICWMVSHEHDLTIAAKEGLKSGNRIRTPCIKCGEPSLLNSLCHGCMDSKIFMDKIHVDQTRIKKKIYALISNVKAEIPLPKDGKRVIVRTQVALNNLALLIKIHETHGTIDDALIATYSFDQNSLVIVLGMVRKGMIKRLKILLSNTYYFRYPKLYVEIKESMLELKKDGFDVGLCFATTHIKITLIKCGENYYQIEGTMNYSVNNLCEQVSIENDKELYDYDHHILANVISNKKSKRLEWIC